MKKGVILLTFMGLFDKDGGKEIPLYCECVREDIRTAVCADEGHSLLTSLHSRSWTECLEEAGKQKSAEVNYLQRCGLALQFDWKQHSPCLVNLTADLSLTGTLLYLLPAGVVRIGWSGVTTEDQQPDIALSGPLVQSHHWYD